MLARLIDLVEDSRHLEHPSSCRDLITLSCHHPVFAVQFAGSEKKDNRLIPMHPMPPTSPPQTQPQTGLGIFHFLLGGLWLPLGLIVLYLLAVAPIIVVSQQGPDGPTGPPISLYEADPNRVLLIGTVFILIPALLWIASGICLLKSRARGFSLTVAVFSLLFFPFGTLLGLWTLIAVSKKRSGA